MRNFARSAVVVGAGVALLSGCGATDASSVPSASKSTVGSEEPMVWRTIVRFEADGTRSVVEGAITRADAKADLDQRKARLEGRAPVEHNVVHDTGSTCYDSDFVAYVGTGCSFTSEAYICFYGNPEGTVDMSSYTWCNAPLHQTCTGMYVHSWVDAVRSYDNTNQDALGYWYGTESGGFDGYEDFSANQTCTTASTWAQHDETLTIE